MGGSCARLGALVLEGWEPPGCAFSPCSLLWFSHFVQGITPSTCKILYQTVQSLFCTLWLQKLMPAKILLIVQVTCQKISWKSILGSQANGLSSTCLAAISPQLPIFDQKLEFYPCIPVTSNCSANWWILLNPITETIVHYFPVLYFSTTLWKLL